MKSIVKFVTPMPDNNADYLGERHYGRFCEKDNMLFFLGKEPMICIANFTVTILHEIDVVSQYEKTTSLLLQVSHQANIHVIKIPRVNIEKIGTTITEALPQLIIYSDSRNNLYRFSEYFREIYSRCQSSADFHITKYQLTGWHTINGIPHYYSASDLNCISPRRLATIFPTELPTITNIGNQLLQCATLNVSLPAFIQLHLGVMSKLYQDAGIPVQHIMSFIGKTGVGKTRLCRELFCNFNVRDMVNIATSTKAGIEAAAMNSKDLTLVLDDIFTNNNRALQETFESILRQQSDSTGRVKMINTNDMYRAEYRCGIVMTAESIPTNSQQSTLLRMLIVPIEIGEVNHEFLSFLAQNRKQAELGQTFSLIEMYLSCFIKYLENNYMNIVQNLALYPHDNFETTIKFNRHFMMYIVLKSALDIIINFMQYSGCTLAYNYNKCIDIIQNLIKFNESICAKDEPHIVYLKAVISGMNSKAIRIASNKQDYINYYGHEPCSGYLDGGYLYLDPVLSFNYVQKHYCHNGFISTYNDIFFTLRDLNISECYGERNHKSKPFKKVTIKGIPTDMLCLNIAKIKNILSQH